MREHVILVDENGNEIGTMPKLEAHQKGVLHRAFSVFIFNSKGEILLQQRVFNKYHSGGLWSNTCCSHPIPGEDILTAAYKRLDEEMGMYTDLKYLFPIKYKCKLENGLIEHELDHVFAGISDNKPIINLLEVAAWKYSTIPYIKQDVLHNPKQYTYWFTYIFDKVLEKVPTTMLAPETIIL